MSPQRVCWVAVWSLTCLLAAAVLSTDGSAPVPPTGCVLQNTTQGVSASCTHLHLTSVPKGLPADTIKLDLSYNSLTVLHNDDFLGVPLLLHLIFQNNMIAAMIKFIGKEENSQQKILKAFKDDKDSRATRATNPKTNAEDKKRDQN